MYWSVLRASRCLNAENVPMIGIMARRPFAILQNVLVCSQSQPVPERRDVPMIGVMARRPFAFLAKCIGLFSDPTGA
eukprot:13171227-Heterocapsa_arctica.AAC.1